MYLARKMFAKSFILIAITLFLTGCGASIQSVSPDPKTTLYLPAGSVQTFSVSNFTGNNTYLAWSAVHYDSSNTEVSTDSLGSGLTSQYTFDATAADYFRTEIQVHLMQYSPILSQQFNHPIYVSVDSRTWELSKPIVKVGSQIPGSFFIRNRNDTDQLAGVSTITGNLFIDSPNFRSTTALNPVTTIGGNMVVYNSQIRNFNDLDLNPALTVGGKLVISHNFSMNSLAGLENLTQVAGLTLNQDNLLTSLQGLTNLQLIDGDLVIDTNAHLLNLQGTGMLTTVNGSVTLNKNLALTSTDGTSLLTSISGDLVLSDNGQLQNLAGFSALNQIGGTLKISGTNNLTDLSGLDALTSIFGISISDSPVLNSLNGLGNLTTVTGDINLRNNPQLASLHGLESLTSAHEIALMQDPVLTSLQGLDSLSTLNTLVANSGNNLSRAGLTSLSGMTSLKSINVVNLMSLALTDLSPLDGKLSDNGKLQLIYVAATALPVINATVLDNLQINETNITNLNGLGSITQLGTLSVTTNNLLTDLSGLNALTRVDQNAVIGNNSMLCQSAVDALVTQLQNAGGIGGTFDSYNNNGC